MVLLIESLHRDHVNLAQLLNALERQLTIFDAGEVPDYDIIQGVIDYCLNYPDLYHHPREDLIYERLKAVDPAAAAAIGDLAAEHKQLNDLTDRFAAAVHNILQDLEVSREVFEQAARAVLEGYRQHMGKEERDFLPAAERSLGEADWAEIESRLTHEEDPLFGAETVERFTALRRDILHWAEPPT